MRSKIHKDLFQDRQNKYVVKWKYAPSLPTILKEFLSKAASWILL